MCAGQPTWPAKTLLLFSLQSMVRFFGVEQELDDTLHFEFIASFLCSSIN